MTKLPPTMANISEEVCAALYGGEHMTEKIIKDCLKRYLASPCPVERRSLWLEFVKAHKARSSETVKQMERERGLA